MTETNRTTKLLVKPTDIFQELLKQAKDQKMLEERNARAMEWYRKKMDSLHRKSTFTPQDFTNKEIHRKRVVWRIGEMYCFHYHPEGSEELTFYDEFPLIFPIEKYNNGFLGINFHYLPPTWRAKLMFPLYQLAYVDASNEMRLRLSYKILNSFAKYHLFRPCLKRYLFGQMRSPLFKINSNEWDMALFLPIEQFKKHTKQKVWIHTRKNYGSTQR